MDIKNYLKQLNADTFKEALQKAKERVLYILPSLELGVNGLIFDVVGEESLTLENEITDYYTADNTAIQNYIAIKPISYRFKGYISEIKLNNLDVIKREEKYYNKLENLSPYNPTLSERAMQYLEKGINKIFSPLTNSDLYEAIRKINIINVTKQKLAYLYLSILRDARIICAVSTPYQIFTNMVIQNITITQDETTREISEFDITLREFKISEIQKISLDVNSNIGRTKQNIVNNGITTGKIV